MSSIGPQSRRIGIALLGLVFLGAAVFFPFGSTPIAWTYEYTAEEVTPSDSSLAGRLGWVETTEMCSSPVDECELTYRVKDEGSQLIVDTTYRATRGFSPGTKLVIFRDAPHAFYQPNVTQHENGSTRIELTPVSNETALALVSTPIYEFPRGVQRIVREGQVRTNSPLSGFALWEHTHAVISYNGDYYEWGRYAYRGTVAGVEEFLRLFALALGAVCCFRAG